MMKLDLPLFDQVQALSHCMAGVTGNNNLLSRIANSREALLAEGDNYAHQAGSGDLFSISPISPQLGSHDPFIGELCKSDMIKMYEQYFVDQAKPARKIYDDLRNAAREKCPFCGGIGFPRTLDHFLPKKSFPQFSVLPLNLVPSCRDCNMEGKAQGYATRAEEQYIHPYRDRDIFFTAQWIYARYILPVGNEPGKFEYYITSPSGGVPPDAERVRKHFQDFDIARRYSTKAGEALGTVLSQIERMKRCGLGDCEIVDYLLQPAVDSAPFLNHWQRGMHQALIASLSLI